MNHEQTANVIRHVIQDALDNHELSDGSFAMEHVGDIFLNYLESRVASNLLERALESRVGLLRDFIYKIVRDPDSPVTEIEIEQIARDAVNGGYRLNEQVFDEAQERFRTGDVSMPWVTDKDN